MKNVSVIQLIAVILLIIIGFYFAMNRTVKANDKSYNLKIYGIIKEVNFNEKGYPNVEINGTMYYFSLTNPKIISQILVGDSIVKNKFDHEIYQYRHDSLINVFDFNLVK